MSDEMDKQLELLEENAEYQVVILCNKCEKEDTWDNADIVDLYQMGWRVIHGEVICPKCMKK